MSPDQVMHTTPEPHLAFMRRAIALARHGEGLVEPNPMVGCVLVRGGRVIGEGWHRRFGGPHAEIDALARCEDETSGCDAYVTLEPCRHFGKTPPCTDALISAGVRRVYAAIRDPDVPSGGGAEVLRQAGVEVVLGVCADEARELAAPFLTRVVLGRPYVIAKWAQSLDGKLATRTGDSKWISGEAARRLVHRLRGRVDAIVVGAETARRDDPELTARGVRRKRLATRVVLDGGLRTPARSHLVLEADRVPTLILTSGASAHGATAHKLRQVGVEVRRVRRKGGGLSVSDCLRVLHQRGATNVLVEGGPRVLTSWLGAGVVDEAWVFVSPRFIGGSLAPSALLGTGCRSVADSLGARVMGVRRVGRDVLLRVRLTRSVGSVEPEGRGAGGGDRWEGE